MCKPVEAKTPHDHPLELPHKIRTNLIMGRLVALEYETVSRMSTTCRFQRRVWIQCRVLIPHLLVSVCKPTCAMPFPPHRPLN